jgi:transcriptional regulator with XRE-family HTH domain
MTINPSLMTIRAKKLGVLIRDARLAAGKSADDCAQAIGVPLSTFEDHEFGRASPSLPQIEFLALYLKVPYEHFWGTTSLSEAAPNLDRLDRDQLISLRQRKIGALVRQARLEAGLTGETLAAQAGISAEALEDFEFGRQPISLPLLEAISAALNRPLEDFRDRHSPVGRWISRQSGQQDALDLPSNLREFVAQPVNRPYLEVARRLSELSVDKLRAVAEVLLDITL